MPQKPLPVFGVDILRLLAALMVVGYHLGFRMFSDAGYLLNNLLRSKAELEAWWPVTWFGWVGVQVFFVISGFVIAFSSEGSTTEKFIRSRALRLVPGMWVCVLVCAPLALAWGIAPERVAWLAAKTALFVPIGPWIAGQVWTIGIELAFYAVILALLWCRSFHRVETVAYVLTFASAAYWALVGSGTIADTAGRITQLLLLQHGCYFAIGLFIWIMSRKGASAFRISGVALATATAWFQIAATLGAEKPDYELEQFPLVPFLVWLTLISMMAASVYCNAAIVAKASNWAPSIRTAGMMTYSLYLLHYHVGGTAIMAAGAYGAPDTVALILGITASVIAAYTSAKLIEPVIYNWLKGWADRMVATRPSLSRRS